MIRMARPAHPGQFIKMEVIEPPGLSVTEAAKVLGVTRAALSTFSTARAALSPDMALRIEKAFGPKMDTLLWMQTAYEIAETCEREAEIKVERYVANPSTARHAFFQKRASRLVIPMLSWFFVYFLWVHYWQRQPITFPLVVRRLILGGPYYHLYFLYVIGFLYAITPLLKPYFTKLHPSQRVRVIAFCLSLGIINSLIFYRFYNHKGWFDQLSSFFPMFAFSLGFIGYFLAGYHLKTLVLFQNRSVLFLAFFILSVLTTSIGTYGFISRFGLYSFGLYFYDNFSPPCIIMSFSTFLFIKETVGRVPIQHNRKFVDLTRRLLAPAAFGVYLLHPIVLDVLWYFLISIPPEKQQSIVSLDAWSGIPLISAGVIVTAFGATVLIQRLPYVRRVVGRM